MRVLCTHVYFIFSFLSFNSLDPKTNYYVEVKGASDEMQRPWMPLTQTSPNQYQNSDEHIYE